MSVGASGSACFYLPLGLGQVNVVQLHTTLSPHVALKGAMLTEYRWMPGGELEEDDRLEIGMRVLEEALISPPETPETTGFSD